MGLAGWIIEQHPRIDRLAPRGFIPLSHQVDEDRLNLSAIGAVDRKFEIGKVRHATPKYDSYRLEPQSSSASCHFLRDFDRNLGLQSRRQRRRLGTGTTYSAS
jgi:hypothetical protein